VAGAVSLFFLHSDSGGDLPSMITVSSNDNSRTCIDLPDGTQVHLNSSSSITYPSHYTGIERNVTLTGEAYFNVARDERKPFVVTTPEQKYRVRVLGTEFNMQAWEEEDTILTSLVSGSVQVDIDGEKAAAVLSPSQKAIYSTATGQLQVVATDTDRDTDWMWGRLVFRKTPMPEVLARLSRFYNVEFEVENDIIKTYRFTGTFEDKPLFQVLEYMNIASDIDYSITYRNDRRGTSSVVILKK
jgi:ferric-dicitrate binding protein FerR (iron transport regulator)